MDINTVHKCISCDLICSKKLVKSLCPKCYRQTLKTHEVCKICNNKKYSIFTDGKCQACKTAQHRITNPHSYVNSRLKCKEKRRLYEKKYEKLHKKEKSAREAKRRALKMKATPFWVNATDIKTFYKNRLDGMEVDHIIPLKNKDVCGLHVPWNLQYLTEKENSKKINKFDGTQENNGWRAT